MTWGTRREDSVNCLSPVTADGFVLWNHSLLDLVFLCPQESLQLKPQLMATAFCWSKEKCANLQQLVILGNVPWLQILHISSPQPVSVLLSCGNEFCRLPELYYSLRSRTGTDLRKYFLTVHVNKVNRILPSVSHCWNSSSFESKVFKIPVGLWFFYITLLGKKENIYLCMYMHISVCVYMYNYGE